jgi:ATP-dependent Zn protease
MKAYHFAYGLVAKHGMDSIIGYVSFPDVQYTKPYGEAVESEIDREVHKIIV